MSLLAILLVSRARIHRRYSVVAHSLNAMAVMLLAALLVLSGIGCGGGGSQAATQPQEQQQAATPAILPPGGTFTGVQSFTISDSFVGAIVYYTTDGSTPTTSSTVYSGPVNLNSAATVQAIATASGYKTSSVASANDKFKTPSGTYTITVIPTVTAAGSNKSWQSNAIALTLSVR